MIDWTAQRQADAEYARGYRRWTTWLQGKTLAEAQQVLAEPPEFLGTGAYRDGADAATRDYIENLESQS